MEEEGEESVNSRNISTCHDSLRQPREGIYLTGEKNYAQVFEAKEVASQSKQKIPRCTKRRSKLGKSLFTPEYGTNKKERRNKRTNYTKSYTHNQLKVGKYHNIGFTIPNPH